jgi:glycogen(starch) synthase
MNILYLCDEYPPGRHGGIGTSIWAMAHQMVKLGHKVVVAGLYSPGYGGENEFDDEGIKVYRFRWNNRNGTWFRSQGPLVRIINSILKITGITDREIKKSIALYKVSLEKLIAENQIDVVEMPDYNDYVRFCRSYIPFPVLPVPVIVKMHGSATYFLREENKQAPAHIFKMEQAILNQAAAVTSVSRYTADKSAMYFSYHGAVEILYNGIDTNMPEGRISRNPRQVIYTGTLVQKKGIYQLAKAWNIVNKEMPDTRLLVLGKGPRQKVISYLTKQAKQSVIFMGHVATKQLIDHLAGSAISVFPSYAEAFAMAPLEAMACGTAVINSNRTSGTELIDDNVDGMLIDPDNITQIASSILYLLNHPDDCKALSKKGNEKVRREFEISKLAVQTVQFYNDVLNRIK